MLIEAPESINRLSNEVPAERVQALGTVELDDGSIAMCHAGL
jgi:hypothetical protein